MTPALDTTPKPDRHAGGGKSGGTVEIVRGVYLPGLVTVFARNEEVYAEDEPAGFVYKVVSGAVRVTRLLADGRRHLLAFYLPGEVFGLETGDTHRFSAEALSDSHIAMVRRSVVNGAAATDGVAAQQLWRLACAEVDRLQEHAVLLGRKTASERVAAFLLEMAERTGATREIALPMSRTDIADYLGLTIETVSRTLNRMKRDGALDLPNAGAAILRDRSALQRLDA